MMEESVVKLFADYGLAGALLVVLIYDVFILQKKLIQIIEDNTKAFVELRGIIGKCQDRCEDK